MVLRSQREQEVKTDTATCEFCRLVAEQNGFLSHNQSAVALFDRFPVNPGHTLIIPKRHTDSVFDLSASEWADIRELLLDVKRQLESRFHPAGYNIGVNYGRAAGQTIFHVHVHLIPRYYGDVVDPRGGVRNLKPNVVKYP